MNSRWTMIMGGLLAALLVAASIVTVLKIDLTPEPEKGKAVVRTRNFGEGIRLTQHGLYGIDLVSIGKAHMRKLRKGPFTIGAINELVLENVSLALPEELWKAEAGGRSKMEGGTTDGSNSSVQPSTSNLQPDTSAKAMLGKLGINAGQLKMGGKMPRFSALTIRNLRVSRIEGTNAVPWFAAARGEAKRGGLKLESGWSVDGGVTNQWESAFLVVDPELKLWTEN